MVESFAAAPLDHQQRYAWADRNLPERGLGLDIFCGCGYGTSLLRGGDREVFGLDGDLEAVAWAREHFGHPAIPQGGFHNMNWPTSSSFALPGEFDFIVSLESVEHVKSPFAFITWLCSIVKPGGTLVVSSPNGEVMPKVPGTFPFHTMHLPEPMLHQLLQDEGFVVTNWAGQNVYQLNSEYRVTGRLGQPIVTEERPGQFSLVSARKKLG